MPKMTKKRILMFLGGTLRVRYKLLVLVAWSILVCLALVSSGEGLASCPSSFFRRSKLPGKGWLAAATPPMEPGSLCRFCSASRFQALAEEYWRWYWPYLLPISWISSSSPQCPHLVLCDVVVKLWEEADDVFVPRQLVLLLLETTQVVLRNTSWRESRTNRKAWFAQWQHIDDTIRQLNTLSKKSFFSPEY